MTRWLADIAPGPTTPGPADGSSGMSVPWWLFVLLAVVLVVGLLLVMRARTKRRG